MLHQDEHEFQGLVMTTPDAHIVRSGKRHLKVTHFTPTV